jgi:DNA helicase-2/ATP-dependent DNA helicase PcrA
VLDPGDSRDLLDMLRPEHGLAGGEHRFPAGGALQDIYSRSVNTATPARDVITSLYPWCEPHTEAIVALLRGYMSRKRSGGMLDFDDLLLSWRALLSDPVVGPALQQRWDHVLVDEYQDVNQIQVDIVRLLRPEGVGLTVVGDDAQAVYGFRGSDSRYLTELSIELADARTVRLEQNFRSRQRVLDLVNTVRPPSDGLALHLRSERTGGTRPRLVRCHDAATEARAVVDAVLAAREESRTLKDQAVLMRASHHSDLLEVELTARGVPFRKYGGLKFLEAAHVKDFVAGVRLLDNRLDEIAWFRLLRLHDGIGPARARDLVTVLAPGEPEVESRHADVVAACPASTRTSMETTFARLVAARAADSVADQAAAVLELVRPLLVARYADHPARIADVERLVSAAATSPTLAEYVVDLTLDPPASTGDLAGVPHLDEDYLTLSTVHSAKGLEWDCVHVIHVVDGAFPSDMALTSKAGLIEEQRLFYVATTRARDELSVYTPLRMPHHRQARDDKHSFALASRFLSTEAMATVQIVDVRPGVRTAAVSPDPAVRVELPTLDELWA